MKAVSRSKQRQVAKTWSVEGFALENAPFRIDIYGKREIHSVLWGYMLNLVSNVNTMLNNLHKSWLKFSLKLHCHVL